MEEKQIDGELIFLVGGDKCGNLHLFKIERIQSLNAKNEEINEEDSNSNDDNQQQNQQHLSLIKPIQSITNLTKDNASIAAIYSQKTANLSRHLIVCCCKDSFYRVFEFDSNFFEDENDEDEDDDNNEVVVEKVTNVVKTNRIQQMLKLVNKYQINSYIDLIESFEFEKKEDENGFFELEKSLKLALCFYGDKFILWNFHLSRSLFEFRCGGANRSWDFEFQVVANTNEEQMMFRFFYIKNKNIGEARKILHKSELQPPINQSRNHFGQLFHGNTIKTCKFLDLDGKYLLTGSEDTMLILNKIENNTLMHQFHLQGHDSVVRWVKMNAKISFKFNLILKNVTKLLIKTFKCYYK